MINKQRHYYINYSKIDGPAQKLIFLGVLIDTGEMTLSLPDRKLADFHGLLQTFQNKRRATKRQLESLIGSLNWASQVIQGGRSFMRRMIDLKNTLKNHSDKALLNSDFSADLEWWLKFMKTFNGRTCILDNKPISSLQCDACSEGGCVEDTLVRVAAEYRSRGWAESTKRLYRFQLKCYLSFCETMSIQPVPVSTDDFSLYIAYLAHYKKFRFCTIQNYLAVVKHLHKANGLKDPITDNWHIKHLLLGVKRDIGDAQVGATAVTPNMLLMIKKELNLCRLYDLSVYVACLIGFFGLLRPGNFLFKDKHNPILRIEQIGSIDDGFIITFHKTKTIQFREKQLNVVIPQITGHPLCPASALYRLLSLHQILGSNGQTPLLCESVIKSLSYVNFISFVNDILANVGCGDKLTGHSFRRGEPPLPSRQVCQGNAYKILVCGKAMLI
ncbi:unnamed protein product [Mytilus edulis]|uniref:Core-binding (CB) domain-containing protein n=1 Tax=Mytilus edulis TaxID=6550 RepID=A0A8S3SX56_MYTED|nr:unnamed protein product [Mytilus edulis]